MIDTVLKVVAEVKKAWPRQWSNVAVRFLVNEARLGFECDDKDFGTIRVMVYDQAGQRVSYLEGQNDPSTQCEIGFNLTKLDESLLQKCFHMARNLREFERTGEIEFAREFGKCHREVVELAR